MMVDRMAGQESVALAVAQIDAIAPDPSACLKKHYHQFFCILLQLIQSLQK
jgi:hypothetical protein